LVVQRSGEPGSPRSSGSTSANNAGTRPGSRNSARFRPPPGRRTRPSGSAHNFAPIRSIYRWQGEVHERTEGRVSLHTRQTRVSEIVARVKQEHPYEVPSISTRPITGGNPDYLAWIAKETTP
jgi:periplasmic divalent cation tolerance protein